MHQYLVIGFISLLTLIPLILTYVMVNAVCLLIYQGQCLNGFQQMSGKLEKLLGEKGVALHFCSTQGEIEEEYS